MAFNPYEDDKPLLKHTGWEHVVVRPQDKYAVTGYESQIITFALENGDSVKGEPGVMMYQSSGVTQRCSCDGFCARCCAGEDCFVLNFDYEGEEGKGYVGLTPNFPMQKVVPVDLSADNVNGKLIAQSSAFMASVGNVTIGMSCDCNPKTCCCAGTGMVRQKLEGDGLALIAASGTIIQKTLADGEVMIVDTNCILAFADSCKLDIKRAGGIIGMFGGGEGIFNTTLTGPGLVLVQSMNEIVFREAMLANKLLAR